MTNGTNKQEEKEEEEEGETAPIGVLLCNTGSPSAPEPKCVRAYLAKFLNDPNIRPMNRVAWWFILHLFVFPKRAKTSAQKYKLIWTSEGSPFNIEHEKLRELLETELNEAGINARVALGMNYSKPFIKDGLAKLYEQGCKPIVCLPLYPQSAFSTTRAVRDAFQKAKSTLNNPTETKFVDTYSSNEHYLSAVAASIKAAGFGMQPTDTLLCVFHSVPQNDIDAGDTYEAEVHAACSALAKQLQVAPEHFKFAYNCRFDKGRTWLSPSAKTVLAQIAANNNCERVFLVCPNFATDCLETHYDVKIVLKSFYEGELQKTSKKPSECTFTYIECLNGTQEHARVLANVIAEALKA